MKEVKKIFRQQNVDLDQQLLDMRSAIDGQRGKMEDVLRLLDIIPDTDGSLLSPRDSDGDELQD